MTTNMTSIEVYFIGDKLYVETLDGTDYYQFVTPLLWKVVQNLNLTPTQVLKAIQGRLILDVKNSVWIGIGALQLADDNA